MQVFKKEWIPVWPEYKESFSKFKRNKNASNYQKSYLCIIKRKERKSNLNKGKLKDKWQRESICIVYANIALMSVVHKGLLKLEENKIK